MVRLTGARRLLWGTVAPLWRDLLGGLAAAVTWQGAALLVPLVLARAVDEGVAADDTRRAVLWVAALVGLGLVQASASALRHRQAVTLRARGGAAVFVRVARRALGLDPPTRERWSTGEVLARGDGDVERVAMWLDTLPHTLGYAVTAVAGTVLLASIDLVLATVVLVTSVLVLVTVSFVAPLLRQAASDRQRAAGRLARVADETLTGYDVLAGLGGRAAATDRLAARSDTVRGTSRRLGTLEANALAAADLAPQLTLVAVLLVAGGRFASGDLTAGDTLAAVAYIGVLLPAMRILAVRITTWQRAAASAQRITALLDEPDRVTDPARPRDLPPAGPAGRAVALRGVTVHRGHRAVLDDVQLSVRPGERLVIVGAVGSGKTTLTDLVSRRLDPDAGAVTLDGVDLRDLRLADVRAEVASCDAEPRLTRGTLDEVVRLPAPDAPGERVAAVARAAAADRVAAELPHGWRTLVGERGFTLSGGQRQRAALARTLLSSGSVVVLDDATSALDAPTATAVVAGLDDAVPGRTVLAVTSRPEALALADRVAVLDEGRLVAVGTPAELAAHPALRRALDQTDEHDEAAAPPTAT